MPEYTTWWFLSLQDFFFQVQHRAGAKYGNANGLSRGHAVWTQLSPAVGLELRAWGTVMAGLQSTHNAHHAPRATTSWLLNGQRHFSTLFVLDSKGALDSKAGWQKHTRLAADDWSTSSSPYYRRAGAIKGCSRHRGVSSCFMHMSDNVCFSLCP